MQLHTNWKKKRITVSDVQASDVQSLKTYFFLKTVSLLERLLFYIWCRICLFGSKRVVFLPFACILSKCNISESAQNINVECKCLFTLTYDYKAVIFLLLFVSSYKEYLFLIFYFQPTLLYAFRVCLLKAAYNCVAFFLIILFILFYLIREFWLLFGIWFNDKLVHFFVFPLVNYIFYFFTLKFYFFIFLIYI